MSDNSSPNDKRPPPKPGTVSSIIRANEEQRREAARRLAKRHLATRA